MSTNPAELHCDMLSPVGILGMLSGTQGAITQATAVVPANGSVATVVESTKASCGTKVIASLTAMTPSNESAIAVAALTTVHGAEAAQAGEPISLHNQEQQALLRMTSTFIPLAASDGLPSILDTSAPAQSITSVVPNTASIEGVIATSPIWTPGPTPMMENVPIECHRQDITMPPSMAIGSEATHAQRNSHKAANPPGHRSKRKDKFTVSLSRITIRQKRDALNRDLRGFRLWREQEIKRIAHDHHKHPDYIRRRVLKSTTFKSRQPPTLWNALQHMKAQELNKNLPTGCRAKPKEIREAIANDQSLKSLTPEHQQEIIEDLIQYREEKALGVRVSNKAANLDYQNVVKRIQWELDALYERTGVLGFAVFSRSHVNDSTFPAWLDSKDALQFFVDVFKVTPKTLAQKFEVWAVAQEKHGKSFAESLSSLKQECKEWINDGLNKIMNRTTMEMQYLNYKRDICLRFHIQLRGWPSDIPFEPPSRLSRIEDARRLRDALRSGECAWVEMSARQHRELAESLKGETVKTRATRKDKGQKRGKRKQVEVAEEDENIAPASGNNPRAAKRSRGKGKQVARQLLPGFQSTEMVESSEDD